MSETWLCQLDDDLTIPYEVYVLGSRVGARAHLDDVRTHNVEADLKDFGEPGPMDLDLKVEIQVTPPTDDEGAFIVAAQYRASLNKRATEGDGGEVATISVGIAGLYRIDRRPDDLRDEEVEAFARSTAALALHAYARELISSMTQRFGLPLLILPPLRVISDEPMNQAPKRG